MPRKPVVAVLALVVALTGASAADAAARQPAHGHGHAHQRVSHHKRASAHKRRMRRLLLRELRRHPRLIMSRRFIHRADTVGMMLPLTVRLNPIIPGATGPVEQVSDDSLALDIGTGPFADPSGNLAGAVAPVLRGKFGMVGRFDIDTAGLGDLGDLALDAGTVQMTADPFPLVEPSIACPDGGPLLQTGPVSIVTAPPLPAGDQRGGYLNWFKGDISMRLYTQFDLNSQRRASCTDPFFWTDRIASTSNSVVPIDMVGHFSVSPTLSFDGRLRLFKVRFDNAVIPQVALPAFLHTCTQATATLATDPAPTAACDGVSGDDVAIPMSVKLARLTAEVFVGDA